MKRREALMLATGVGGLGLLALAACSKLTAFNAIIPKDNGVARVVTDAAFGPDPRQRLDIYRPASSAKNLPVIVFFYGGSWNSGDKAGYSWVGRALAARGFLVAIPNYRLVPKVRYPDFVKDGAAAVRLVAKMAPGLGANPDRIVLAGHSAGAYNAAMLAYDERWLGADKARIRGFIGLAGPYDFLPLDGPEVRAAFGIADNLPATQPVNFVGKGDPPALLAVAGEDRTIGPHNAVSLAARLRAVGVPVETKDYLKVGHVGIVTAIAQPLRGRARVLDDVVDFSRWVTAP